MENPNLFILKPAAPEALPKHILHDMIFMTRNVARLQAMLAQLREKFKFAVTVRKGEHAWLRVHKEEHNLGMGVPSYTNPFRIALGPLPVFYAQVKEEGLWASKVNAVMVVQPMGVVCFLADEAYEIEAKREFFCLLPITEHLRLTDKKNSKEAPDKKIVVEYGKAW
uniref:Predicted protein n=1 Tax=Hordeum vulgare subsp. vulgare TaxID=112509 RepID=F2DJQ3_HORVV|nr:predicted protein [Hordeum vulgare subsp. vulgare]